MKITNEGRSLAGLGALIPSDGIPEGGTPPPDCCDVGADPIDHAADGSAVGLSAPGTATLVQAVAAGNSGADGGGQTATLSSTPTAGNILIAIVGNRDITWAIPPTGYTELVANAFDASPVSHRHQILAKVSDGTDGTITFDNTGNAWPESLLFSEWSGFGGVLPTVDTSATSDITDDATPDVPAVTPTSSTPILLIASNWKQPANPNPGPQTLSGYTLIQDTGYAGLGNRHRLTAWYRWVPSTSGTYGPTTISDSTDGSDDSNVIHVALAGAGSYGSAWVIPEPNVTDGDDATYDTVSGTDLLRIDLGAPFRITSTRVRIAANTSGSRTFTIKGANAVDFSDEVTLATIAFTATGSYTAQNVTGSWSTTDEYRYFELSIGTSDTYRIHAWELFGGTLAGDLATHSHTLDGLSDVDTTGVGDGDVLTYDSGSGSWIADAPAGGALALDDLTDVNAPSPADGDALVWDNGAGEWVSGAVAAAGGGATAFIGASVYKSSDQVDITTSTGSKVTFDSTSFDTDGFFDNANDRFTIPAGLGGKYLLTGVVVLTSYAANSNDAICWLRINGNTSTERYFFRQVLDNGTGQENHAPFAVMLDLAAGDYVEVWANPGSRSDVDIRGTVKFTNYGIVKLDSGKVGAGIGATATSASDQTITTATPTAVTFATEDFDTDGFHSTSVNTSRLTVPTGLGGKYLVVGYLIWDSAGSNIRQARIYKNGAGSGYANSSDASSTYLQQTVEAVLDLAAGDYVELFAYHERGSDLAVMGTIVSNKLSIMRLDSGPAATSGTAFPSSPATGYKFFRTDLGLDCYYDGTRWLTTNVYTSNLSTTETPTAPTTTSPSTWYAVIDNATYAVWVERLVLSTTVLTTNNGSHYWTLQLTRNPSATNLGSSVNTSADTAGTNTRHNVTVGASTGTSDTFVSLTATKTGSPGGLYMLGLLVYRLVIT